MINLNKVKTYIKEFTSRKEVLSVEKKLSDEEINGLVGKISDKWKEVSVDKVNQLIKNGLFNVDNIYAEMLEGTSEDVAKYDVYGTFSTGQWQDWRSVASRAYTGNMVMDSNITPNSPKMAGFVNPEVANKIGNVMTPAFLGYGQLALLETSPWVNKILDFKADNLYGKGIALTGDGSRECNRKIENIMSAWSDYNLDEEITTLARWTYLFGGADMAVGIKGLKDSALQRPLKFNDMCIPQNSITQFQAVCPYLSSPMIPNNVNAFSPFFYDVEHRMVINKLTHVSRLITMNTKKPNQLIAPQYQYRGVSLIQVILKYLFQIITSSNATAQAMIQNALWIYETSVNYQSDPSFQAELQAIQNQRDNTMFVPVRLQDKIYIVQIDMSSNSEIIRTWMDMLSMLINAPQTVFVGSAAKGMNATGEQEMKNFHDTIDAERIKTQYNQATRKTINYLQCSVNKEIDPVIKITNIELDESYDKKRAEISQIATDVAERLLLAGLMSPEQITSSLAQQKWFIFNSSVQTQVDEIDSLADGDIEDQQYVPMNELNSNKNLSSQGFSDIP